jgi:colanic acid/amylovoran biosynthesis glycosyltransferase
MKPLFYLAHRYPVITETFTVNEIRSLSERGLDVTVRTLRDPPSSLPVELAPLASQARTISPRAGVIEVPSLAHQAAATVMHSLTSPRRSIGLLRGLALAREVRGAHVHAQFPLEAATAGYYAAKRSGASYSFSGHTLHQLDLMPEKLAAASFVTVGSQFERATFAERYGDRWSERIHVRRLGVPPRDARAQSEAGLVVAAGTLTGKKGHDILIRAFAGLDRTARLEIVGDGPDRPALEALAAELGVQDRVRFHGWMGHARTLETMARAAAFALCCRKTIDGDHDCLPVALMDAMSIGVPCVSTHSFGIPELITNGESGLLVPPGDHASARDALATLLDGGEMSDRIGVAGRTVVRKRFDLATNTARLADLFARFLS